MRIKALPGIMVALLALVATGCSARGDEPKQPYAAELEQARAQAKHPEIIAALADGKITDEEIQRSKQIALDCLAQRGQPGSYDEKDALTIAPKTDVAQEEIDSLVEECAGASFDLLSSLRQAMEYNPQNIPSEQMLVDCYKRMNLVSKSMTVDEFMQLDLNNPPWDKLSGDAAGCMDDPKDYRGGRRDLTEEEAGQSEFIRESPTP